MTHTKGLSESHSALASHASEGERLERQIWADAKALNFKELEKKIAPEFQSLHLDGVRNRAGELDLIKELHLGDYYLSNFKVSHDNDTIVVTYSVSADETIDLRHLSPKATWRMSVWKKNHAHQWQWISHTNLHSLGKHS